VIGLDGREAAARESLRSSPPNNLGTEVIARVLGNAATLLGGRVLGLALSAGASVLLVRYLGSELAGTYASLYAYLALFGWLASFGLEAVVPREVAQRRDEAGMILTTGVVAGAVLSAFSLVTALSVAPFLGYEPSLGVLVLAAVEILGLPPLRLPGVVFQVDLRQWYGVGIGLARQVVWLAAVVGSILLGAPLRSIVLVRLVIAVVEVGVLLVATSGFVSRPLAFAMSEGKALLAYAYPVALSTLAVGIYHRVDQVMIHKMLGDHVLGQYAASVNLAEPVSAVPVAVMASLFPVLAQAVDREETFSRYVAEGFRYLMFFVCACCVVIALAASPIVRMLYGEQFRTSASMLAVLTWSEIPVYAGVILTNAFIARGAQGWLPLATGVGALVNLALNLVLIPKYGGVGASWATVVSYWIASLLVFALFPPTRPLALVGVRATLLPTVLSVGVVVVLNALTLPVAMKVPVGLAAYCCGAAAVGAIRARDLGAARSLMARVQTQICATLYRQRS
jgi:O-antigen/teichoic acid export membrane protein